MINDFGHYGINRTLHTTKTQYAVCFLFRKFPEAYFQRARRLLVVTEWANVVHWLIDT